MKPAAFVFLLFSAIGANEVLFAQVEAPSEPVPSSPPSLPSLPSQSSYGHRPDSIHAQPKQVLLVGAVMDAVSGESLPSATLQIEGTLKGTVTNTEGYYSLAVDSLPVTLTVRYLGFKTGVITAGSELHFCSSTSQPESASENSPSNHISECRIDIRLEPSALELPELVITGEDPALSIMEKVIARKQLWRPGLQNFKAIAYSRLVLESDTSIALITESVNEVYWDRAFGFKEILKSSSGTSNIGESIIPLGVNSLPNFYDDTIEIFNFDVVGVTHPDALSFYRFKLLDYQRLDEDLIFEIEVAPRRELQPTFEGTVFVRESDFSLLEVRLRPNRVVTFPPPVQTLDFTYLQQYSSYGTPYLLPVDSRIEGTVEIGLPGLRFPTIRLSQLARVSEYEINTVLPQSVVEQEQSVLIDSASVRSRRLADQVVERVPLSTQEREAYDRIDSTMTLEEAFQPTGFLAKQFMRENPDDESNSDGSDSTSAFQSFVGDLFDVFTPRFRLNRVDGLNFGGTFEFQPFKKAKTSISAGWSTERSQPDGGVELEFPLIERNDWGMDLFAGALTTTLPTVRSATNAIWKNESVNTGLIVSEYDVNFLFNGSDLPDYYLSEEYFGGLKLRPSDNVDVTIGYSGKKETSALTANSVPLIRSRGDYRVNPPIQEGWIRQIQTTLAVQLPVSNPLGGDGAPTGLAGTNRIGLHAEISDPVFGSEFSYTSLLGVADASIPTFYRRRLYSMTLNVHVEGGWSFGNLPRHHLHSIEPALLRFTMFGRLKTLTGAPYQGNRYWLAYAEHDLQSIPFELIGLWPLAKKGVGIIVFAGAGQTILTGSDWPTRPGPGDLFLPPVSSRTIHSEAGFSINRIFSVLRVDVAWRLDKRRTVVGLSIARYF